MLLLTAVEWVELASFWYIRLRRRGSECERRIYLVIGGKEGLFTYLYFMIRRRLNLWD